MADSAYERLERATADLRAPFALVDIDALWANADMDLQRPPPASRSGWRASRCAAARCSIACWRVTGFRGTLAFTLPEALWLASHGAEDLLVAYPTPTRTRRALAELAGSTRRGRP
jgi:D-serine deaminase-like pyridoxal phosphate-dependent protein